MKKHSTCQKDKSIEKGITTIWTIYIVISEFPYCYIMLYYLLFSTAFYFIFGAFQAGCPVKPPRKSRWLCPTGRVWAREEHHGIRTGHHRCWSPMGLSRWVWRSKPFPNGSSAPIRCCSFGQDLFLAGFTNMGFSLERQNLSWSEGASIFRQKDNVGYILSLIWFHGSNSSSFGSLAQERPQARGDWGGEVRSHQRKNGWYIQNKQNHVGKTMP